MSRKARLYELMVKRENIELRRKSEVLNELISDQDVLRDLDQKLAKMVEENQPEQGPQSVQTLRSKAWYGSEMARQQEFTANRLEFLDQEIVTNRSLLVENKNKERIIADKALEHRKSLARDKEQLVENLMPHKSPNRRF
jgi:serine phosphatase RsbU (regulator of sigma subunit)